MVRGKAEMIGRKIVSNYTESPFVYFDETTCGVTYNLHDHRRSRRESDG